jgi:hypothetical protein
MQAVENAGVLMVMGVVKKRNYFNGLAEFMTQ